MPVVARAADLPAGYTYASWALKSVSRAQFGLGGRFYSFNFVSKNCWPKNPAPSRFGTLLFPFGGVFLAEFPGADFPDVFDLPGGKLTTTKAACAELCRTTAGCRIATYSVDSDCSLKQPDRSRDAVAGIIFRGEQAPPPQASCSALPAVCLASQCGTAIKDNCGNPVVCPPCPGISNPPSSNPPTAAIGAPSNAVPSEQPRTVVAVVTVTNSAGVPALVTQVVFQTPMAPPSIAKDGPSIGFIAGCAAGFVIIFGALFLWLYKRKQSQISTFGDRHSSQESGVDISRSASQKQGTTIFRDRSESRNSLSSSTSSPSAQEIVTVLGFSEESEKKQTRSNPLFSNFASARPADNYGTEIEPSQWSVDQVAEWVSRNGGTTEAVYQQELNGSAFMKLNVSDLVVLLGITAPNQRAQFEEAMEKLNAPPSYS
ncbi:hypothetical protein BDR26DRAFT_853850 [Obelidium mucronatum]|nr:hypothetical protein BDR26DRAFT_853850 [Obelidium mucronatum]